MRLAKMNIRKTLITSNVLLLAIFIIVVAKIVPWALSSTQGPGPAKVNAHLMPRDDISKESPNPTIDYSTLADSNLFTEFSQTLVSKPAVISMPKHLKLIGTVVGHKDVSRAIIKNTESKSVKFYKIDETVEGAVVTSIDRDVILLTKNGQQFELGMTQDRDHENKTSSEISEKKMIPIPIQTPRKISIQQASGMQSIFRIANLSPVEVDGTNQGLKITGIQSFPLAKELGLKENDVIQSINGHMLSSKRQGFQVLQKAKTQPVIEMKLIRDGKNKNFTIRQ